ncbi:MAG: shikimate kinase, partial [Paramuribaculum sp.]|nr:shikimate kinase [Paramuribaculum sp.]
LNTSLPKLHTRLMRGRHKRPLIADKSDEELKNFIVEALEKRMPHYSKAKINFAGDLLENECEVTDTANRFISLFNLPVK